MSTVKVRKLSHGDFVSFLTGKREVSCVREIARIGLAGTKKPALGGLSLDVQVSDVVFQYHYCLNVTCNSYPSNNKNNSSENLPDRVSGVFC